MSIPPMETQPITRTSPLPVHEAARRRAAHLTVDEAGEVVHWRDDAGARMQTGLHDYAALYAVPGLYEAAYFRCLHGRAPHLLTALLTQVVAPRDRPDRQVLDVGAGTGVVGEQLVAAGFSPIAGTDLERASERAIRRDRDRIYGDLRTMDLSRPGADDLAWLRALAPRVVTIVGAVGFGHLPVAALTTVTRALPPRGLLALTVARGVETEPDLADHAALLLGPAYRVLTRRDGLHRRTADGARLDAAALVLERTEAQT